MEHLPGLCEVFWGTLVRDDLETSAPSPHGVRSETNCVNYFKCSITEAHWRRRIGNGTVLLDNLLCRCSRGLLCTIGSTETLLVPYACLVIRGCCQPGLQSRECVMPRSGSAPWSQSVRHRLVCHTFVSGGRIVPCCFDYLSKGSRLMDRLGMI